MRNPQSRASPPWRSVQVLVGVVTASCAVFLLALQALYVRSTEHPLFYLPPVFWILSTLVLFFAITSFRLLTGRGASTGDGLLSPAGYRAFGGSIFLVGVLVVGGLAPSSLCAPCSWALCFSAPVQRASRWRRRRGHE